MGKNTINMSEKRIEITNDEKFRHACVELGLSWISAFNVYENTICLTTEDQEFLVILDKNYNIIDAMYGVCYSEEGKEIQSLYAFKKYHTPLYLPYPFSLYSRKQIMDLGNRIVFEESNHGHSIEPVINGNFYASDNQNDYLNLLFYLKFLRDNTNRYAGIYLHALELGLKIPSIDDYLKTLIDKVNILIDHFISLGEVPFNIGISSRYLGINKMNGFASLSPSIIEMLLRAKGFMVDHSSHKLVTTKEKEDLTRKAEELKLLLDEPYRSEIDYSTYSLNPKPFTLK